MQTSVHLGRLLLKLYEILGEDPPNHIRYNDSVDDSSIDTVRSLFENEPDYSAFLREVLEANGWFRTRSAHPAWQNIGYNVANRIALELHNNPLSGKWELNIALFAPWPTDWNAYVKFGYLKGFDLHPKLEEIYLYWGKPICFLQITEEVAEISRWQPLLLKEQLLDILAKVLKIIPEGHLIHDPKSYCASGWYGYDAIQRIAFAEEQAWEQADPLYQFVGRYGYHKVLTDQAVFYVLYCTGTDQFESRLFETPEEVVTESMRLERGDASYEKRLEWARNTPIVHNLKRENIHEAVVLCGKLKRGKALTSEEARIVQGFYRFLDALVGRSDLAYTELNEYMSALAGKLGTNQETEWVDFAFSATDKTFGHTFRSELRTKPSHRISTVNERKIAGRYVSRLAMIALIVGPKRRSAHEMIDWFRHYPCVTHDTEQVQTISL